MKTCDLTAHINGRSGTYAVCRNDSYAQPELSMHLTQAYVLGLARLFHIAQGDIFYEMGHFFVDWKSFLPSK